MSVLVCIQRVPAKVGVFREQVAVFVRLFVCLLLNGTSALFRPLVPRIVEIEHTNHVKNDLK
jgi:hypothetical protein